MQRPQMQLKAYEVTSRERSLLPSLALEPCPVGLGWVGCGVHMYEGGGVPT